MRKKWLRIGLSALTAVIISAVVVVSGWQSEGVTVTNKGSYLSISVGKLAVQTGQVGNLQDGGEMTPSISRRAGVAIKGVNYKDGIYIDFSEPHLDIHLSQDELINLTQGMSIKEAEAIIIQEVQSRFETTKTYFDIQCYNLEFGQGDFITTISNSEIVREET
jgi:hypothetical protein